MLKCRLTWYSADESQRREHLTELEVDATVFQDKIQHPEGTVADRNRDNSFILCYFIYKNQNVQHYNAKYENCS